MKKITVLVAIVLALSAFAPMQSEAKPAYCTTALMGCYGDCQGAYSSDLLRSGCYGGCLIGYAGCGA